MVDNDYAWNKVANMLYVEVPSGVGFSYSDTLSDYVVSGLRVVFCWGTSCDTEDGCVRVVLYFWRSKATSRK